jgi:hypothetical protein
MRKLLLGAAMLLFAQFSFGQAVADQAVIPISVTLNSILRLTIVSGGNIQFVVNTIDEYENGIVTSARYQTTFNVASSRDFDVLLNAESATFFGTDDIANTMPLNNVGFQCDDDAGGTNGNFGADGDMAGLQQAQFDLILGRGAGGSVDNQFIIMWELGTSAGTMNGSSLLSQSLNPDNYVTNVFLVVDPE